MPASLKPTWPAQPRMSPLIQGRGLKPLTREIKNPKAAEQGGSSGKR